MTAIPLEQMDCNQVLLAIEQIKQLKARYFRLLDQKLWDEWRKLFTDDFTGLYQGDHPDIHFENPDQLVDMNRQTLDESTPTVHHGHMPEIELQNSCLAYGVWAMEDYVCLVDNAFRGYGHYEDVYVKEGERWKINSIKLSRLLVVPLPAASVA